MHRALPYLQFLIANFSFLIKNEISSRLTYRIASSYFLTMSFIASMPAV